MASGIYLKGQENILNGTINLGSDNLKVALISPSYVANFAAHENWSDISSYEITGTGYTSGGTIIGSKTITSDGTDTTTLDSADTVLSNVTTDTDFRYVVLYSSTANKLISLYDIGVDWQLISDDFTMVVDPSGYLYTVKQAVA